MAGIHCLALIGDKGFDAGWLRERLRANDTEAVIPLRQGTSGYAEHDREKYKWRHLVENFFCCIKAFRRIATRYEKTDKCFAAIINLVATVARLANPRKCRAFSNAGKRRRRDRTGWLRTQSDANPSENAKPGINREFFKFLACRLEFRSK